MCPIKVAQGVTDGIRTHPATVTVLHANRYNTATMMGADGIEPPPPGSPGMRALHYAPEDGLTTRQITHELFDCQ